MKPDVFDLLAFAGAGLIVFGAWLIYEPMAYIVAGIFLTYIGIIGAKRNAG